jgi:hypothetical protein
MIFTEPSLKSPISNPLPHAFPTSAFIRRRFYLLASAIPFPRLLRRSAGFSRASRLMLPPAVYAFVPKVTAKIAARPKRNRLQPYPGFSGGNSGVSAYACGPDFIFVEFRHAGTYLYTHARPGRVHVAAMKKLAVRGHGMATYINRHVRSNYAKKWEQVHRLERKSAFERPVHLGEPIKSRKANTAAGHGRRAVLSLTLAATPTRSTLRRTGATGNKNFP